jgi:hypothetical protein
VLAGRAPGIDERHRDSAQGVYCFSALDESAVLRKCDIITRAKNPTPNLIAIVDATKSRMT